MVERSAIALMASGLAPRIKANDMSLVTDIRPLIGRVHEPFAGAWQRNLELDTLGTMTSFGAVFACVSRIANDVAKLGLNLMMQREDGTTVKAPEASPHWIPLRSPNTYQNRIQFVTLWLIHKLLHGNVYALKVRDGRGMVAALYLIDPRRGKPMVAPNGDIYYQFSGDELSRIPTGIRVPASEVIHDRGVTLWHPLVGVPPIYACAMSSTQGVRIQRNSATFFNNMSRPSGMLTAPGTIDDVTAARLKREWTENYSGQNLGKLAVLGDGLKYEAMTIPAEQAQLIEQLKWTVEDVARAFAMPLYKIGAGPIPSNNNVEALNQQYYADCLQVYIEAIELCLDEGLRVPAKHGVEFDLEGLMRMDTAAQVDMLTKASGGAWMKINEARSKRNLPPAEGGNTIYKQHQDYSIEALAKRDAKEDPFADAKPPAPPAPPAPPETPAADEPDDEDAGKAMQRMLQQAIVDARDAAARAAAAEAREQTALALATSAEEPAEAAAAAEIVKLTDALLLGLEQLEPANV